MEEVSLFVCAHYAHLTSFAVESLFTNIQLEETTNICADSFFENNTKVDSLTTACFLSLLELATLDYFLHF